MVDILTRVFKAFPSDLGKENIASGASPPVCNALLVGEHRISRSLLLLSAVTEAAEAGTRVQFFAQSKIQSLPVCVQKCVPNLCPESLKKINFSYPRTLEELLQQVASLHESSTTDPFPPSLIIVDRLDGFLPGNYHPGVLSSAAHLAALLCDTAVFLTGVLQQRDSSSAPCRVLASYESDDASESPAALDVLDRYFSERCTLDKDASYEAAAAGLQEIWNIYFSGPGVTEAPGVDREWQLLVAADDSMEFKLMTK